MSAGKAALAVFAPRLEEEGRPRVLVVDDEAANRELLSEQLASTACRVRTARDGVEALMAVDVFRPDLILLDVRMPGLDGLAVCRRLKSRPDTALVPIVLVTGSGELEDRIRGLAAGAEDFLDKPVDARVLEARVASLLRLKRLHDGLDAAGQVVMSLAVAIDARSPYTRAHSTRVAQLARMVGQAGGLGDPATDDLYQAGQVHDVGKIGLPDSLLTVDGLLDVRGWELVRRHPIIGERILAPLRSARRLGPIVRHHHESYDGRGYPDSLAGDEIPLAARILAVCDAYDAMVSDRPYRRAMNAAAAFEILRAGAGRQWDPSGVSLFRTSLLSRVASPR